MGAQDDEDFLSRWSARKLKARSAPAPEPAPAEASPPESLPGPPADPAAETAPGKTDAEILDELGLPNPDSLVKGDDFGAFLRVGIPARLRARALRRLWVSDPVLANLDGLNDYEQDFTDKATVLPGLKTAYRVGKGYLRDPAEGDAAVAVPAPDAPSESLADEDTCERRPEGAPPDSERDPGPRAGPPDGSETGEAETGEAETGEAEPGEGSRPIGAAPADAPADPAADAPADPGRRPGRMRFRFASG